jgi:hypothetical protein
VEKKCYWTVNAYSSESGESVSSQLLNASESESNQSLHITKKRTQHGYHDVDIKMFETYPLHIQLVILKKPPTFAVGINTRQDVRNIVVMLECEPITLRVRR